MITRGGHQLKSRWKLYVGQSEAPSWQSIWIDTNCVCGFCLFPIYCSLSLLSCMYWSVSFIWINHFSFSVWRSSGHYNWLQYDRRVLDHEFPKKNALPLSVHHHLQQLQPNNNHGNKCALVLYFLIKYVPPKSFSTCATYVNNFHRYFISHMQK
jgi:hypothetical protein